MSANLMEYSDLGGGVMAQLNMRDARRLAVGGNWKNPERIQQSLTAATEKRILLWLAARTPAFINPDHLTALGAVSMLLAGICYGLARYYRGSLLLAALCLALNWLGDSLDGTLARYRRRQRPRYGFYVDHVVDTLGALFLMTGLALSGYIHAWIAIAMLVAFLALSAESYLATHSLGSFRLSYGRLGPTEIRILLAIGNCVVFSHPYAHLFGRRFLLFDVGGVVAICGMALMFAISAVVHTIRLYREEKL